MIHPASWTAKLYHAVPQPVARYYRRLERECERLANLHRRKRFAKEWRTQQEILNDPNSTGEQKRLARIELVAWEDPDIRRRAAGEDE